MYGKCESFEEAVKVFNDMIDKDAISWTSGIAASARNGRQETGIKIFTTDASTRHYIV